MRIILGMGIIQAVATWLASLLDTITRPLMAAVAWIGTHGTWIAVHHPWFLGVGVVVIIGVNVAAALTGREHQS